MPRALPDGLYEHLLTSALAHDLTGLGSRQHSLAALDPSDSHEVLARHIMLEVARALKSVEGKERVAAQVSIANRLLHELSKLSTEAAEAMTGVEVSDRGAKLHAVFRGTEAPGRPSTPLASSTLLTRKRSEPSLGSELAKEIESADRIDVLVAFISMGGIRALRPALEAFALRGDGKSERLRVLTTVFTGTTEVRALQELARLPGASVKVSYDTRRTRLHAKAWLLHRDTDLHTAYIGSANLTSTALGSGHEWMMKVCAADLPQVIKQFSGTFDVLWSDPEFEELDPNNVESIERLRTALKQQREPSAEAMHFFTLRPFSFQEEILDRLEAERSIHARRRNLVVAATGTGKTLIAAFDYERQVRAAGVRPRLLFLAHRKELLVQARDTFRQVLQDGAFGEMLVDGELPRAWDHVFASIQSASRQDLIAHRGAEHFRYVVVDECHHAPAESYRALVPHLKPEILLGLTATPERTDGKSLLPDFDGHIAAELRIWHAMERQLLVPFEYYGISDNTDLTRVRMTRGGYDEAELAAVYTSNDIRANLIEKQLRDRVADPYLLGRRRLGSSFGS
jgi:HKD family nuclease